jgi:hypothetical protein
MVSENEIAKNHGVRARENGPVLDARDPGRRALTLCFGGLAWGCVGMWCGGEEMGDGAERAGLQEGEVVVLSLRPSVLKD